MEFEIVSWMVVANPGVFKLKRDQAMTRNVWTAPDGAFEHENLEMDDFLAGFLQSTFRSGCSVLLNCAPKLLPSPAGDKHAVPAQVLRPDCSCSGGTVDRRKLIASKSNGSNSAANFALKSFHHFRRLRARQRADGKNQFAARLHAWRDIRQQVFLNCRQLVDIIRGRRPARLRIALPGSHAAARRVHEHAVEFRFRRQLRAAIPEY